MIKQLHGLSKENSQIKAEVTKNYAAIEKYGNVTTGTHQVANDNRNLLVENKKMISNLFEVVSAKKEKENQDEAVVIDAYQMKINYLEKDNARLIRSIKKRRPSSRSRTPCETFPVTAQKHQLNH